MKIINRENDSATRRKCNNEARFRDKSIIIIIAVVVDVEASSRPRREETELSSPLIALTHFYKQRYQNSVTTRPHQKRRRRGAVQKEEGREREREKRLLARALNNCGIQACRYPERL